MEQDGGAGTGGAMKGGAPPPVTVPDHDDDPDPAPAPAPAPKPKPAPKPVADKPAPKPAPAPDHPAPAPDKPVADKPVADKPAPGAKPGEKKAPEHPEAAAEWLATIFVKTGKVNAAQAAEVIKAAGPDHTKKALGEKVHAGFKHDSTRAMIKGKGRAHELDWEHVHKQIAPANTDGKGTMGANYGSLREAFYEHRAVQLHKVLGVSDIEQVLAAEDVAEAGGRRDIAGTIEDLLFRAHQFAVVETLNVTQSVRYVREPKRTFCNIYAHDFILAMGGYLPRVWWRDHAWAKISQGAEVVTPETLKAMQKRGEKTDDVVAPIYEKTVTELNANSLNNWFREHGAAFGWGEVSDMTKAQDEVNKGMLGVVSAANKASGRSGHISVILQEDASIRRAARTARSRCRCSHRPAQRTQVLGRVGAPGSKSRVVGGQ